MWKRGVNYEGEIAAMWRQARASLWSAAPQGAVFLHRDPSGASQLRRYEGAALRPIDLGNRQVSAVKLAHNSIAVAIATVKTDSSEVRWEVIDKAGRFIAVSPAAAPSAMWSADDSALFWPSIGSGRRGLGVLRLQPPGASQILPIEGDTYLGDMHDDPSGRCLTFRIYSPSGTTQHIASLSRAGDLVRVHDLPQNITLLGTSDPHRAWFWSPRHGRTKIGSAVLSDPRLSLCPVETAADDADTISAILYRDGFLLLQRTGVLPCLRWVRSATLDHAVTLVESSTDGFIDEVGIGPGTDRCWVRRSSFHRRSRYEMIDIPSRRRWSAPMGAESLDAGSPMATVLMWAASKDGTQVPYYLCGPRGAFEDSKRLPAIVTTYGGYGVPTQPAFKFVWRAWLETPALLLAACPRGGGELGEEWHRQGRLGEKLNTFNDVAAIVADARRRGFVGDHVVGMGQSCGGLSVVATQFLHPGTFSCLVSEDAPLDVLHAHDLDPDKYWWREFGDAQDPNMRTVISSYSPVTLAQRHDLGCPILVVAGESDGIVSPEHARRFVEALRARNPTAPATLWVMGHGHDRGQPTSELAKRRGAALAFAARNGR